ncbi:TPA: hypothetical protein ACX6MF_001725 [Photobacterium damselae]
MFNLKILGLVLLSVSGFCSAAATESMIGMPSTSYVTITATYQANATDDMESAISSALGMAKDIASGTSNYNVDVVSSDGDSYQQLMTIKKVISDEKVLAERFEPCSTTNGKMCATVTAQFKVKDQTNIEQSIEIMQAAIDKVQHQ